MKEQKLQTWKSMAKKIKVLCTGETVNLQKDWNLFARMMVICKSRPEIDIKEAVRTYEFRVVPRLMFAANKTMLHCPAKSALRHILEKLPSSTNECRIVGQEEECPKQRMRCNGWGTIPGQAQTYMQLLSSCWSLHLLHLWKAWNSDEIRLIFDRYNIQASLKQVTHLKRQGQRDLIYYRITPFTLITKVIMKNLPSHTSTKDELAK